MWDPPSDPAVSMVGQGVRLFLKGKPLLRGSYVVLFLGHVMVFGQGIETYYPKMIYIGGSGNFTHL